MVTLPVMKEIKPLQNDPADVVRLLDELDELERVFVALGIPRSPGYRLEPPLGRRPRRGPPPKSAHGKRPPWDRPRRWTEARWPEAMARAV